VRELENEVSLTERETEVLQRVAKGYTLPEIASSSVCRATPLPTTSSRSTASSMSRRAPKRRSKPLGAAGQPLRRCHDRTTARQLAEKEPAQVLVDCHGVGYEVDVPMSTFYNLPDGWARSP
jgi:hypothetical protein